MRGLECALQAGKKFVRPETGFVHYHYHGHPDEPHVTIPLYENLNWALTLFQTRTQEGVQEGKRVLDALLAFQNKEGEFPVYLHEYPYAKDLFLGAYLFFPLYWIQKNFHSILGSELRERLQGGLEGLVRALKRRYKEREPQGIMALKIGAIMWVMEGDESLLKAAQVTFNTSSHIADVELCKDLGAPHLPNWPAPLWHKGLQTLLGGSFRECQEGYEPMVTLLDLMMGSPREGQLTPHHLAASLIQSSPVPADGNHPGIRQGANWGYSAHSLEPGCYLFRLVTKSWGKLASLVITPARIHSATFEEYEGGIRFRLGLEELFEADSREKQREVEMFVNRGAKISCSTFHLNEPLMIAFEYLTLTLTFSLLQGKGDFVGHLAHGNRPSQIVRGDAFDQVLVLRTLRRSPDAVLGLDIAICAT